MLGASSHPEFARGPKLGLTVFPTGGGAGEANVVRDGGMKNARGDGIGSKANKGGMQNASGVPGLVPKRTTAARKMRRNIQKPKQVMATEHKIRPQIKSGAAK